MSITYNFDFATLPNSFIEYKNLENRVEEMFRIGKAKYLSEQATTEVTYIPTTSNIRLSSWDLLGTNIVLYLEEYSSTDGNYSSSDTVSLGISSVYIPFPVLNLELNEQMMAGLWSYIVSSLKDKHMKKYLMVCQKLNILEKEKNNLLAAKEHLYSLMTPEMQAEALDNE